jgi:ribulose 1,5-bisphosphate carboxylase large subunit-like protein
MNNGNIVAEEVTATVMYTDVAHDKVVSEIVKEGVDLFPNKESIMEFESEYIRERTEPKTDVNVTVRLDWKENGESKTLSIGD